MKLHLPLLLLAGVSSAALIPLNGGSETAELKIKKDSVAAEVDPSVEKKDLPSVLAPLFKVALPAKSRYIVVYKDDASEDSKNSLSDWISEKVASKRDGFSEHLHFFGLNSFNGYLGLFDDDTLDSIRKNAAVKYVEEDSEVEAQSITTQDNAEWGLVRVSHVKNAQNGKYLHDSDGGEGVTAYIVDSGVMTNDPEFEGRASLGKAVAQPNEKYDTMGHGTHVAGTVGSKTYGVAKKVNIVSVSVFNTNDKALISDILTGFEWVINDHKEKVLLGKSGFKGSTLNMSIGGANSNAWTDGINAVVNAGIHAAVSAGNENQDACNFSPGLSDAITVGGTDINDDRYTSSNYGKCVDINAPAVNVGSVGWEETPSYKTGTSMASPHVCGVAAYLLSLYPGQGSEFSTSLVKPLDLKKRLNDFGTKDKISNLDGDTPNVIVYQGGNNPTNFWN